MLSCIGSGRDPSEEQAGGGATVAAAARAANTPPHLSSPVELSGTLQKRGPTRLHRYAARHFELRGRYLVYRRGAGAAPAGYVDLCGAVLSANRDGPFGFYICSCYAHRDYALLADTAAQRRDWTDALMRNITACTTPASVAALLTAAPASSRSLRKLKRYPTHSHYLKDQLTSRALHEGALWRKTGAVGTYRRRIYELLPEGVLFYTRDDDEDCGPDAGSPRRGGCVPSAAARGGGGGGGGGGARSHNRYYKLMNVRGASAERTSDGFVLRGPFLRDRSCTFLTETPAAREAWLRAFQAAAAAAAAQHHAPPLPPSLLLRPCAPASKALPSGDDDEDGGGGCGPRRRRPVTTSDLPPPTPSSSSFARGGGGGGCGGRSGSAAASEAEAAVAAAAAARLREVRANRVPLSFPQISRLQHSIREAEGLLLKQGGEGRGGGGEEVSLLRAELDEARQAHLVWLDLYDMERDQVVGDDMCDAVDDALEAAEDEAAAEAEAGGGGAAAAAAAAEDAERRLAAAEEWLRGTFVQRHVAGGGGGVAAEEGPAVIPAEAFRGRLAAQRARLLRLRSGDAVASPRVEEEAAAAAAGPALWDDGDDDEAPYDESVGSSIRSGSASSSGCGGEESGGGACGDGAEAAATFRTMGAGGAAAAAAAATAAAAAAVPQAVPVPAFGGAAVEDRQAVVASVCACATRVQEVLVRGNVTSKNRGGIGADVAALAAWRRGVLAAAETFGRLRRGAGALVIVDDDLLSSTLSRVESVVQMHDATCASSFKLTSVASWRQAIGLGGGSTATEAARKAAALERRC